MWKNLYLAQYCVKSEFLAESYFGKLSCYACWALIEFMGLKQLPVFLGEKQALSFEN